MKHKLAFKTDSVGGKYTLNPNGDVWLKRQQAEGATLLGDIHNSTFRVFRCSHDYLRTYKGWGIPKAFLLWRSSFPFHKVFIQTAVTAKGDAYTGTFSRQGLLTRPVVRIPKQELQVIVTTKEMKKK